MDLVRGVAWTSDHSGREPGDVVLPDPARP
jgi:hypothetical protein